MLAGGVVAPIEPAVAEKKLVELRRTTFDSLLSAGSKFGNMLQRTTTDTS
jgi:hypothetical protein